MITNLRQAVMPATWPSLLELRWRRLPAGAQQLARTRVLLPAILIVTTLTHAYHMFLYPLYAGDEGIYMEQAWSVLKGKGLAPYTYFYDHAPAGWILIAAWLRLLPGGVHQWGMAVNSGRVLMLILAVASTALLYRIALRFSGSPATAVLVALIFTLSPLSLYYGRMVLLDNIMVFWLLLALDLLTEGKGLFALLGSGAAFGIAVLTKENAIFFAPVLGVALYFTSRERHFYRYGLWGWCYTCLTLISFYPLYALLKGELIGSDAFLLSPLGGHVSLLGAVQWQIARTAPHGSILDYPHGQFWDYYFGSWLPKDGILLVGGVAATGINVVAGLADRAGQRRPYLIAAALTIAFAIYLVRGAVLLDFYIVPLLPFLALNMGLAAQVLLRRLPSRGSAGALLGVALALSFYFVRFAPINQDAFTVQATQVQAAQLAYVRTHIPTTARVMIDDDLWVDLHDGGDGAYPVYPHADSHWKVAGDPAVRDNPQGIARNWRRIDYVVASDQMLSALRGDSTDYYHVALRAYLHSFPIWRAHLGGITVSVRKVAANPAALSLWAQRQARKSAPRRRQVCNRLRCGGVA